MTNYVFYLFYLDKQIPLHFSQLHALHYQESVSQVPVINLKSDGKGHWENAVHKAKKSQLGINVTQECVAQ